MREMRAREMARPTDIVHAHDSVGETLACLRASESRYVVAMDGDEIALLLDGSRLSEILAASPWLGDEMIGNLDSIAFRVCRQDDDCSTVIDLLHRSNVDAAVVARPDGMAQGVIFASDLPEEG